MAETQAKKLTVSTTDVAIELIGMNKWYGDFHVLRDINLKVMKGERIVIAGPSGSGKSTMIRCINRLEEHQSGTINVDGIELTNDLKKIDEVRREVGMVFQHFNLFPHLTILENCTLAPIWVRKMPKKEAEEVAMHYLKRVKIPEQAHKYPGQLSGGQQQRVALARSLVLEPKILLLDEPFASLDQHLRERLREEVRDIQQRLGITTLFVTHGQDEALSMADRIVVMANGKTEQIDRPNVIYREPQTPFVAGFIGTMNLIEGAVSDGNFMRADFSLPLPVSDGPAILAVRPEAIDLTISETPEAHVHRVTDYGTHGLVDLDLADGTRIKSMVAHPDMFQAGQGVQISPRAVTAYRDNRPIYRS